VDIVSSVITIGSLIAAILAWIAKLKWSKEFEKAKDETIKAKEAQIAALEREVKSLQDMTPMKLREYFNSVKEQLEEYNEELRKQLEAEKAAKQNLERKFPNNIDVANMVLTKQVLESESEEAAKAREKSQETIANLLNLVVNVIRHLL
jgi:predicted RNase H-like nuclease (RuvC/YqgF family)